MSLTKATFSMINGAVFNVLDYGATGNGSTDDTAAITAAFTDAITTANGPGIIFFPKGIYSVTALDFDISNASIHFMGDGLDCSVIRKRAGTTTPVVKIYSVSTNRSLIISELDIDGNNQSQVSCLQLLDIYNANIRNCRFRQAAIYGIKAESLLLSTIERCVIVNNLDGIQFNKSTTVGSSYCNQNVIRDCVIQGNSRRGIYFGEGSQLNILNCDFEQNGEEGNDQTGAIFIDSTIDDEIGFGSAHIDGCWLEGNQGNGIYVAAAPGGLVSVANTKILAPNTGASAGRCINTVNGLRQFSMSDTICVGGNGTVGINSENFFLSNCFVLNLSNSAVNYTISQLKTQTLDSVQKTTKTEYPAVSAATVQNNTLFHDSSSNKISWKDGSGVVTALY